ncbi:MAG: HPF/RaiA family ribosome-associated protein [Planctomyces sp.]|jgi:hypothetical protein|nr:30S ribosomal protein S30 [Planctomycetaceae bacterium]
MRIQIVEDGVSLKSAQREFVERRLLFAFNRFDERIRQIVVSFSDVNGPRGGPGLQCRLNVSVAGCSDLLVTSEGETLEAVAAECAARGSRNLARRLVRRRAGRRDGSAAATSVRGR